MPAPSTEPTPAPSTREADDLVAAAFDNVKVPKPSAPVDEKAAADAEAEPTTEPAEAETEPQRRRPQSLSSSRTCRRRRRLPQSLSPSR